jgi:hypothetical protein
VIAWGGVLAQGLLYGLTAGFVALFGPATTSFGYDIQDAWLRANLWIMVLNLIPIAPLDGAEAWQIFRAMRVESVSFGQLLRRCLPGSRGRPPLSTPGNSSRRGAPSTSRPRSQQPPPESDGEPSAEAQRAIADALRKISTQAREARRKK